ncbi:TRAP transporter substrate-binding protein DctP [Corynebacterium sp. AOP40-9SA-29]|uniref:TRAP transporter substrate-binding protein DctP n=1 Tax=Corynebacterium sp. AOP40-9SA-29 TaxID=3457677 RepID=UPI004033FA24
MSPRTTPGSRRGILAVTRTIVGAVAAVTLLASGTACTPEVRDGTATNPLKMADGWALTHPFGVGGTTPFLDALGESGVEVDYFASGQMGAVQDLPDTLRGGIVDLGIVSPSYNSSEFPLSSVGDLPGFGSDACAIGYSMMELGAPGNILYDEELEDMKFRPLWASTVPSYEVMTSGVEVTSPEDAAGLVLRSPGGSLDRVVDGLDAAGVSMPTGDFYEAISRSTVEGTVTGPVSVTPYGLEDVLTDTTVGAELGSITVFYGINTDAWERLSTDQQQAVIAAAEIAQRSVCDELNNANAEAYQTMEDAGVTLHDISPQRDEWRRATEPVVENWVETAEAAGLPGRRVLDAFTTAMDHYSNHHIEKS